MSNVTDIVRELKSARLSAGLTQRDVAELMGVTQPVIAKIEASSSDTASFNQITQYAKALGMTLKVSISGDPHVLTVRTEPLLRGGSKGEAQRAWSGGSVPPILTFPIGGHPSWLEINGPPGVGKTSIAVRIIEQLVDSAKVFVTDSVGDLADLLRERNLDCPVVTPEGPLSTEAAYHVALAKLSGSPMVLVQDTSPTEGPSPALLEAIGEERLDLVVSVSYRLKHDDAYVVPDVLIKADIEQGDNSFNFSIERPKSNVDLRQVLQDSHPMAGAGVQEVTVGQSGAALVLNTLSSEPTGRPVYTIDPSYPQSLPDAVARVVTLGHLFDKILSLRDAGDDPALAEIRNLLASTDFTDMQRAAVVSSAAAASYRGPADHVFSGLESHVYNLWQNSKRTLRVETPFQYPGIIYQAILDNIEAFQGSQLIFRHRSRFGSTGPGEGFVEAAQAANISIINVHEV